MLIDPARAPRELTSYAEKADFIEKMGVEVVPLDFDEKTRSMTSTQFMAHLRDRHDVRALLVGYDNRFGSDRNATLQDYEQAGRRLGIEIIEAPEMAGISSTNVRRALTVGDVADATRMLGRPYTITGTVEKGRQVGTKIGFPTANLHVDSPDRLWPAPGAYATLTKLDEMGDFRPSMTNIGIRPTLGETEPKTSMESHIFDVSEPLYGRRMEVLFVDRLRDEQRFPSLEALQTQLARDRESAMKILNKNKDLWK